MLRFPTAKEEAMKPLAVTVALLGGLCVSLIPSAYAAEGHTFVAASDLQWTDVPALPSGAKIAVIEGPLSEAVPFTFRIKLPADYKIPAHSHPAIEHVTVISGTFNIGMGDKLDSSKTQPIPAGGVAIMQPKMNHFAWTKEETILQVHGVGPWAVNYVNPADDPRKKTN
jgi:quercetin dioxygenase-like cupin family protein